MKINTDSQLNFRSGFNSNIARLEQSINPNAVKKYFQTSVHRDFGSFYNTDLKNNKAAALANKLCANIFIQLRKVFDYREGRTMQELIFPQDIYVFNKNESDFYEGSDFFVNITNIRPRKEKPTFYPATVFINNEIDSLAFLNEKTDSLHRDGFLSSSHFLHNFVHEWIHAIFTKLVQARAIINSYSFDKTIQKYELEKFTPREAAIVDEIISTYPASCKEGQYSELIAEAWTKFICESLSKDCSSFDKNPKEIMESTPKEFQNLLKKASDIKMRHLFE